MEEQYYSIGEVSKICNISRKALRYYDEIGLVSPDKICDNHYRYYSKNNMLLVPIIRYYKQMGFKLEEMRWLLSGGSFQDMEASFEEKIAALKEQEMEIHRQYVSIREWYDLIREAEQVIADDVREVSVRFWESQTYLFQEQTFSEPYLELLINIDFTNFVESLGNRTKGALVLQFSSLEKRMQNAPQTVRILQQTILDCPAQHRMQAGGAMMLSCYHIGAHETMGQTYQNMLDWAERHHYQCEDICYERFVTDYWTTRNSDAFVTELLIPIQRKK